MKHPVSGDSSVTNHWCNVTMATALSSQAQTCFAIKQWFHSPAALLCDLLQYNGACRQQYKAPYFTSQITPQHLAKTQTGMWK